LPSECPACGLTLILSTHLARSYHHLFPLRNWVEVSWADAVKSVACFACQCPFPVPPSKGGTGADEAAAKEAEKKSGDLAVKKKSSKGVSESGRYACEVCGNHFCIDCDVFAHEVIHNCPGCQSYVAGEGVNGANGEAQTNGAMEVDG
jgi:transcription initiation factor TFIIH subunit 2